VSDRGSWFNKSLFHVSDEGPCRDSVMEAYRYHTGEIIRWLSWNVILSVECLVGISIDTY
jgi:hypothetical protein